METTTLKQLLSEDNQYGIRAVVIPRIQRSYAQGRNDSHAVKTRDRFLKAIHKAMAEDTSLTLDFIYGNVDAGGCLVPLDGQQRLTTLWLLHWYAMTRAGLNDPMMGRFSYHTRYSARDFLRKLVDFIPTGHGRLSEDIRNQGWFPMDWMNDPTISGMLTMLDEIQSRFGDVDDLWEKLDRVNFYFRSIDEMNLTDEIYIKMNSRGKPLTEFEHFKAELLKIVRTSEEDEKKGESAAKRIGRKIDLAWTDMLWTYRGEDRLIDDDFMRYFLLVTHIIIYRANRSVTEFAGCDAFDLLTRVYKRHPERIGYLESAFDIWVEVMREVKKDDPESEDPIGAFFTRYLAENHEEGKSVPLDNMGVNILARCLEDYPFEHKRPNNLQWLTTIYSFMVYLMNGSEVSDDEFRRRLRIILNLQKNSSNEVVDTPKGDAGNRMPAILAQVERIILKGTVDPVVEIDGVSKPNFNVVQLTEEKDKLKFTTANPGEAEPLFRLEDHRLLTGRTAIVGYENTHLYDRFMDLFDNCDYDAIDCAMLAIGDYSQRPNQWCIMLGSGEKGRIGERAWHNLFHSSESTEGFDRTRQVLRSLLLKEELADTDSLYDFSTTYEDRCEKENLYDWRYYYLHYGKFRAQRYGRYSQISENPYELVAIYAAKKESNRAYDCFLQTIIDEGLLPDVGELVDRRYLEYGNDYIVNLNDSIALIDGSDEVIVSLKIPQNQDGIDIVDRLQYFSKTFPSLIIREDASEMN